MDKNKALETIMSDHRTDRIDKENLIKAVMNAPVSSLEIEKYKIDKMIELGLIKEQDMKTERWYQLLLTTLSEKKFMYLYLATLWFIFMIFNSSKYWGLEFLKFVGK